MKFTLKSGLLTLIALVVTAFSLFTVAEYGSSIDHCYFEVQKPIAAHSHNHSEKTTGNGHHCSVAPSPDPTVMVQPDGSSFRAYIRLLENVVYLETTDGYTIMRDPDDQYYRFVSRGTKGNLAFTSLLVTAIDERNATTASLLRALPLHLRYEGNKLAELQSSHALKAGNIPEIGNTINAVFPPTGVQRTLLLLIDFPDQLQTYSVAQFDNLANQEGYSVNGASGSFRDYYLEVSTGQLTVNTDVFGWYTAQNNRATYGVQDLDDRDFNGARDLVREAVDAAEAAGVDFSNYDGDNDGRVDVVEVIHSGRGTEESGNPDDIWSHRWGLGGQSVTYDGKLVNDYIMQAEKYGPNNISNIGVLVHEFGHALGLPDLYDTNGGSAGIGRWCVMAGGTWNNSGRTPAHFSAWCKEQLGWTNPTVLTGEGSVANMAISQDNTEAYRINIDGSSEYFLLENRRKTNWDAYIPGNGLMIYHIDPTQNSNANEDRRRVDIEQADGDRDLNNGGNSGDTGDTYPGSANNTQFDCNSSPSSGTYNGGVSNINISNIVRSNNLISFNYGFCNTDCLVRDIRRNGEATTPVNGTYDQLIEVSYSFPPTTGFLAVTVGGNTQNVAITSSPQEILFTGLPADGEAVTVSATFTATPECTLTKTNYYFAPRNCNNDDYCDALDITANIGGNEVSCSNIGATVQNSEPIPNDRGCSNQFGWCDDDLSNTVWFKFTAPASGSIDIDFTSSSDLQLAVWEVNDGCQSLRNSNARLLVAANDDSGSGGGYSPRIQNLRCLVPGKVYFAQVDGYNGRTANFTFDITDPGLSCNVAPLNTSGCQTTSTAESEGNGTWLHLQDQNGNRIASVNDQFNNLGQISISYSINDGEMRTDNDGFPLMDRDWQIDVENNNAASVRLYLTDAEYQAFELAGGAVNLNRTTLLKVSGADCGEFSGGTSVVSQSVTNKMNFNGNKHMVEFRVTGFSGFFLRSESAVLPIEFQYFTGEVTEKTNLLKWGSATEENTDAHEIERLLPGENEWETIGKIAAAGFSQQLLDYTWDDAFPLPLAYYRIKTVDFDGSFQYSEVISLAREDKDVRIVRMFPNPVSDLLTTEVYVPENNDLSWSLMNVSGQQVLNQHYRVATGMERLSIDLSNQPTGVYFLHLRVGDKLIIRKVVRR